MTAKRSPFPGMDPWLEQHWGDVHHSLVGYARDQIQPLLPPDLRARVEERVFRWHPRVEPVTEGSIEIRETAPAWRLITVIEFLTPFTKSAGECQDLYKRKQKQVTGDGASLVEIDLLRSGEIIMNVPKERLPATMRQDYKVCVTRSDRTWCEYYPQSLRLRLRRIPIPLRPTDANVPLDLQALIDLAYTNGGYDDIDYAQDPEPALDLDDAAWADALLKTSGQR